MWNFCATFILAPQQTFTTLFLFTSNLLSVFLPQFVDTNEICKYANWHSKKSSQLV